MKPYLHLNWSIDGLLELDELGIEYDMEALVDHLCRRLPNQYATAYKKAYAVSCKDEIESLSAQKHVSFKQALKYEEFKSIAINLGIWK